MCGSICPPAWWFFVSLFELVGESVGNCFPHTPERARGRIVAGCCDIFGVNITAVASTLLLPTVGAFLRCIDFVGDALMLFGGSPLAFHLAIV